METRTANRDEIKKLQKEFLDLILKKTGIKHRDLINHAERDFILQNLDVVSDADAKKYKKILLF
jgi:hypothetical protein